MEYDILDKKIRGISQGPDEIVLTFDDGVRLFIKSSSFVNTALDGTLKIYANINITTDKVELK